MERELIRTDPVSLLLVYCIPTVAHDDFHYVFLRSPSIVFILYGQTEIDSLLISVTRPVLSCPLI